MEVVETGGEKPDSGHYMGNYDNSDQDFCEAEWALLEAEKGFGPRHASITLTTHSERLKQTCDANQAIQPGQS
jgi:hypothetical protein